MRAQFGNDSRHSHSHHISQNLHMTTSSCKGSWEMGSFILGEGMSRCVLLIWNEGMRAVGSTEEVVRTKVSNPSLWVRPSGCRDERSSFSLTPCLHRMLGWGRVLSRLHFLCQAPCLLCGVPDPHLWTPRVRAPVSLEDALNPHRESWPWGLLMPGHRGPW